MAFDLKAEFVDAAEHGLGLPLPASYRQAMQRSNGGEIEVGDDVWWLHPIADPSDRKRLARSANPVLKETAGCQDWPRFPAGALAIASNGSGDQLVLLRGASAFEPAVYEWSHETGELCQVAEDFAQLVE